MMKNFSYAAAAAILASQIILNTALAANEIQIQPGDIQISVGGILLDFTGSNSVLDQLAVSDSGDSITTTVSDAAYAQFISSDKRGFTVSPGSPYAKITCEATRSTVTIQTPSGAPSTDFTITPLATTCGGDSGGGGGGGSGGSGGGAGTGAAIAAITPAAAVTNPALLLALINQVLPTATQPPTPITPPIVETPSATRESLPPITAAVTIEAVEAIGTAASGVTETVRGALSEIIQGISTGFSGEALIAKNVPPTPSSIPNAAAIGEYAWQTNKPLLPVAQNKPAFEITERNDYEIIIYDASDSSIKAASGKFNLVNKKPLAFLRRAGESLRAILAGEKTAHQTNVATLAAAADETAPYIKIIDPKPGDAVSIGDLYAIHWETKNLPGNGYVNITLAQGFDIAKTLSAAYTKTASEVRKLRANPAVTQAIKQVAVPTSITVTAISAGAVTVTATVGSASFVFNISQLLQQLAMLRFYALAFIRFKKRKPWGRVYDKLTGKPLQGAKVQIYETQFDKLKDAQLTDADGRFLSAVTPGTYFIKVSRRGFDAQQTGLTTIGEGGQILNLEIALSPTPENVSLEYIASLNVISAIRRFIEAINPYLLAFGTIISLLILAILPTTVNYIGLVIYVVLDFSKIYMAWHFIKPFGRAMDAKTKTPLGLAVVRIIDEEKNLLLVTKVTATDGKFNFLVRPGKYRITAAKMGYAPFRSEILTFNEASLATTEIKMKQL